MSRNMYGVPGLPSAALYPDMSGFDAYDATFPEKDKRILPCQEEFTRASTEIDTRISF